MLVFWWGKKILSADRLASFHYFHLMLKCFNVSFSWHINVKISKASLNWKRETKLNSFNWRLKLGIAICLILLLYLHLIWESSKMIKILIDETFKTIFFSNQLHFETKSKINLSKPIFVINCDFEFKSIFNSLLFDEHIQIFWWRNSKKFLFQKIKSIWANQIVLNKLWFWV